MLFHLALTHTADNCPSYWPPEKQAELFAGADKIIEGAKELNVKVHFLLSGAPEHVMYALLEAGDIGAVSNFISGFPFKIDTKVTPVKHLQDFMAEAKAQLAKR